MDGDVFLSEVLAQVWVWNGGDDKNKAGKVWFDVVLHAWQKRKALM